MLTVNFDLLSYQFKKMSDKRNQDFVSIFLTYLLLNTNKCIFTFRRILLYIAIFFWENFNSFDNRDKFKGRNS